MLAFLHILPTRGLLLAALEQRFFPFTFRGGGSGIACHGDVSAYTILLRCELRRREFCLREIEDRRQPDAVAPLSHFLLFTSDFCTFKWPNYPIESSVSKSSPTTSGGAGTRM